MRTGPAIACVRDGLGAKVPRTRRDRSILGLAGARIFQRHTDAPALREVAGIDLVLDDSFEALMLEDIHDFLERRVVDAVLLADPSPLGDPSFCIEEDLRTRGRSRSRFGGE